MVTIPLSAVRLSPIEESGAYALLYDLIPQRHHQRSPRERLPDWHVRAVHPLPPATGAGPVRR